MSAARRLFALYRAGSARATAYCTSALTDPGGGQVGPNRQSGKRQAFTSTSSAPSASGVSGVAPVS